MNRWIPLSLLALACSGAPEAPPATPTPAAPDAPKEMPTETPAAAADPATEVWSCPMHPEVTGKEGDDCSKCGMKLTKGEGMRHGEAKPHDDDAHPEGHHEGH